MDMNDLMGMVGATSVVIKGHRENPAPLRFTPPMIEYNPEVVEAFGGSVEGALNYCLAVFKHLQGDGLTRDEQIAQEFAILSKQPVTTKHVINGVGCVVTTDFEKGTTKVNLDNVKATR